VAILVADGVDGEPLKSLADSLVAEGAVPRFVGSRFGAVASTSGEAIEVDVTMEATPSVLYDAVVVPNAEDVERLASDARTLEFLKDQYRHCKPILAVGTASSLLEKAGIPLTLPSGAPDPGLVVTTARDETLDDTFAKVLARHRHFERATDPPLV
jgi:catalase